MERQRDPADRRRQIVTLTDAGKAMLGDLRAIAKRVEKEFLAPLGPEERRTLHALLSALASHHDPRCSGAVKPKTD